MENFNLGKVFFLVFAKKDNLAANEAYISVFKTKKTRRLIKVWK